MLVLNVHRSAVDLNDIMLPCGMVPLEKSKEKQVITGRSEAYPSHP